MVELDDCIESINKYLANLKDLIVNNKCYFKISDR